MHDKFKPLLSIIDRTHQIMSGVIISQEDFADFIGDIFSHSIKRVALPDGSVALYSTIDDDQFLGRFLAHRSVKPINWFELREMDRPIEMGTWQGEIEGQVVFAYTGMLDSLFNYILAEAPYPDYLAFIIEAVQTPDFSDIGQLTRVVV